MSNAISAVFISQFDAEIKQQYQGMMKLYGSCRTKTGVVGSTYNFPRINKGLATPRIPQADVTPLNLAYVQNVATLEDWNAPEYTDIFNQQKVNFDDRSALVEACSYAIGRRMDQIIIDEAVATASATVANGAVGFTLAKLLEAKRRMDAAGVPQLDRCFVHSARALEDALQITAFTSSDFAVIKSLVTGELKNYAGFEFKMIEDRDEGGLPLAATVRTNICFHKAALGLAVGIDMKTKIDWVAEKTSWLVNSMFSAGATDIDAAGIIALETIEA